MNPRGTMSNARTLSILGFHQIGYCNRRNHGKAESEVLKADGFHNYTETEP